MWPVTYKTVCFGFVLLRYAIGLKNSRHIVIQSSELKTEPIVLAPTSFPALCMGYMYWLKGLVAPSFVTCQSFKCFCPSSLPSFPNKDNSKYKARAGKSYHSLVCIWFQTLWGRSFVHHCSVTPYMLLSGQSSVKVSDHNEQKARHYTCTILNCSLLLNGSLYIYLNISVIVYVVTSSA